MDKEKFREAFRELLGGMSLREIERTYGINRDKIIEQCRKEFPENSEERKRLEQVLQYNKNNSATKTIRVEDMKKICEEILYENKGIVEAAQQLGIHKQTFDEKLVNYINDYGDSDLKKRYIQYQARRHPDYSFINFKALVIEMIEKNISQSEIANEYGIPARTVSREIEKLNKDEDYQPLYNIAKEYSFRKMQRKPFTKFEQFLMNKVLYEYPEESVIIADSLSQEELQYRRFKQLIEDSEKIEGTQMQKAKELGTSVSTLRRARIKVQEYENKQKIQKEMLEKGE